MLSASSASIASALPASDPNFPASLQGVSARGLVSLERAEQILQRLIDTVNEQGLQISSIFLLLQTLVGTDTQPLPRSLLDVEGKFSRLSHRLERIEQAIQVPGLAPGVSIGEVVNANGVELNHAAEALLTKADKADVEVRQHKLEEEVAGVYAWAGARELVERLEESNRATRVQVHAMETALGCKLDKSELAGMEATVNRLKAFDARMETLERGHVQNMADVQAKVQALEEHRMETDRLVGATRRAVGELEERHGAWKMETLELLKEVDKELAATASVTQLERKLDARVWEREWRSACERLDQKVDVPEMVALAKRLESVAGDLVKLSRESDQYSRFVAWYYSRGQAYEHNMQTLNRTLGRLARDSLLKHVASAEVRSGIGGGQRGEYGSQVENGIRDRGLDDRELILSSSSSDTASPPNTESTPEDEHAKEGSFKPLA